MESVWIFDDRYRSTGNGKQDFRRTDFGSRILATEGKGKGGSEGEGAEDRCR
jgi:hypothetical protein